MTDFKCETITPKDDNFDYYNELKTLCICNAEFFKNDTSNIGKNIYSKLLSIINNIDTIEPSLEYFKTISQLYDFDEKTPGNGYRSYTMVVDAFVIYSLKFIRHLSIARNSYFFRKGSALKEIEACEEGLTSFNQIVYYMKTLGEWSEEGCLFPRDGHSPEEFMAKAQNLNQYCFYGRYLGFQFCESMQTILKGLGILMASYSELYYSNGGMIGRATSSLWNSSKYLVNPELRAKRIVNLSQYASVNFCKQFWFLGEMETIKRLPNIVNPTVIVNRMISIPPEPFSVERMDGRSFDVPIPISHCGPAPLNVRLMSSDKRIGMLNEMFHKNLPPPADGLIFHCHGGGFVSQSSRSHETYLSQWAKILQVPILSIDYSLAPEAPFPRAVEEVFFAYCWALKRFDYLGTTGKRIVAAGDSAGGNIVLSLAVKCIMEGIRPPDGVFLAYTPLIVSITPSPARLLCLMDPLLPLGFLTGCVKAYACSPETYEALVKGFEEKLSGSRKSSVSSKDNRKISFSNGSCPLIATNISEECTEKTEDDSDLQKQYPFKTNGDTIPAKRCPNNVRNSEAVTNGISIIEVINENIVTEGPNIDIDQPIVQKPVLSKKISSCSIGSVGHDFEEVTYPSPFEMLQFTTPNHPLLSPYFANDEILKQCPPVSIMTLHMDPFLDEGVEFAKKLKRLGKNVTLDILEGLPHGFLNFSLVSKDAYEGSKLCANRISKLLKLDCISNNMELVPDCVNKEGRTNQIC